MLPPREGFSGEAVGAIGLLVHRLSSPDDLVLGRAIAEPPFPDRRFRPVQPLSRPLLLHLRGPGIRYAAGVAAILRLVPPDLIEVHNRPEIATFLARRFPEAALVLVLHNDPQGMRGARTPWQRSRLARRVRVVTVSEHLRQRFLAGVADTAGVDVLPNSLDLAALPALRPAPDRDRLILFAGRLVADKGADSFVAACARALPQLPGWRAEMIGGDRFHAVAPDTPFLTRLRAAAAEAGVALPGYQPHQAVLQAMARAAIVVVPSRWPEPFGLTALEAMACGAALVASDRGGLAELVRDAALVIDPDRPDLMADALVGLALSEPDRLRLAAAGQARAAALDLPVARARLAAIRLQALAEVPATGGSR